MLPILQLGPLSIRTPGLALLLGLWLALDAAQRIGSARGLNGDRVYAVGLAAVVAGVIGARLSFVLFNLPLYLGVKPWSQALLSVAAFAPGTEIVWPGLVCAAAALILLSRRWNFSLLVVLDTLAPAATILTGGIGLAMLLSGEAYGIETSAPWGIYLWGAYRQPTQLFLLIASLLILIILWRIGGLRGIAVPSAAPDLPPGMTAQITVIMLSFAILLIEPLRGDSPVIFGGIRMLQVAALMCLIAALGAFALRPPRDVQDQQEVS